MLALCLMLSTTHYAQNYAGIIDKSLVKVVLDLCIPLTSENLRMSYALISLLSVIFTLTDETVCISYDRLHSPYPQHNNLG